VNVALHLARTAARVPQQPAIVAPAGDGRWRSVTYAELDADSSRIARGLSAHGIARGERTLVMVRAGIELITLTYALFKRGALPVLIDPGMGRQAFLRCVATTRPTAFVGIPLAHVARLLFPAAFGTVRRHVTVGARWAWGGTTLEALRESGRMPAAGQEDPVEALADDEPAAILFTSGSTGPAKGAVYTHGNFNAQVEALLETYRFEPGEVDLAAFPLFSLFDGAFGMTSVIPELDPSRPGSCDPAKVVAAIRQHRCTTAFGSPAIWRRVAPWCAARGVRLSSLRRVLIAGASVPAALVEGLHRVLEPHGDVHTPYGATEALPVATLAGREVVAQTAALTRAGRGTCVGRPVGRIEARVIRITDSPIERWHDELVLPQGEVGEICVRGPVVTRSYDARPEATAAAKIADGDAVWHRMGDLGYFDEQGRLWFAGRKAERVETASGTLFTDLVEGLAGGLLGDTRCALVGVGERGQQRPILIVEGRVHEAHARELLERLPVQQVLFHPRLPVDVRHNAKIHRLELARWAAARLVPS
jgi:acyl-CoA synthetase (AMP-forming)/AMP-acid ligase II